MVFYIKTAKTKLLTTGLSVSADSWKKCFTCTLSAAENKVKIQDGTVLDEIFSFLKWFGFTPECQ